MHMLEAPGSDHLALGAASEAFEVALVPVGGESRSHRGFYGISKWIDSKHFSLNMYSCILLTWDASIENGLLLRCVLHISLRAERLLSVRPRTVLHWSTRSGMVSAD